MRLKHILAKFSCNVNSSKNLWVNRLDVVRCIASDSSKMHFYFTRHEGDFDMLREIIDTFVAAGYKDAERLVVPYSICAITPGWPLVFILTVICTDDDTEDWYTYLIMHGCPNNLGYGYEARKCIVAIQRGIKCRLRGVQRAFYSLRTFARTARFKEELIIKSCHPSRFSQIGV